MRSTFFLVAVLLLLCAFSIPTAAAVAVLYAGASCGTGSVVFSWQYYENDPPVEHPEWVGYDVLRRPAPGCGSYVRVNAEPYPRVFGQNHGYSYTETPPTTGQTYEYRVILVDASRQELPITGIFYSLDFVNRSWASCPEFSAPLVVGTLQDWGWTRVVMPCDGSCSTSYYLVPPWPAELEPLVGTGTVVRMYGAPGCGSVEGCFMQVDHWELGDCGPVATRRTTWGRLKTIHR